MSETFADWIRGLLLLFLLLLVAESLLPFSYHRYARFAFALLILLAVLRPWASFLRKELELPPLAPAGEAEGARAAAWSERLLRRAAEEMVREELRTMGAQGVQEVSVEMREGKPWKVKAWVETGEGFSREKAQESLSRRLGIRKEEVYLR